MLEPAPPTNGSEGRARRGEIDVRDGLSYEEFVASHLGPHRPVLVKNAFPDWKAIGKWTPEFFQREHGHRKVFVGGKETTLGEYIGRVLASTPESPVPYLRELAVRDLAPELGDDLLPFAKYALPNWLRGVYPDAELDAHMNRAAEVELFIGGAGTHLERRKADGGAMHGGGLHSELIGGFADLHFDPTACPVLLCQVYGRKQFTIFSPDDTPYLYTTGRHSAIPDLAKPDLERFPLFAKATPYRFVQEPGDAIYVPPFWWHATKMLTVSIAVGSTFANKAHWDGVIDDVVREICGGDGTLRGRGVRAFLHADALLKNLGGPRLGESTHFREPPVRSGIRKAKGLVRAALEEAQRRLGRG